MAAKKMSQNKKKKKKRSKCEHLEARTNNRHKGYNLFNFKRGIFCLDHLDFHDYESPFFITYGYHFQYVCGPKRLRTMK